MTGYRHEWLRENGGRVRRAGLAISALTTGIGASMAWIVPSGGGSPDTVGLGLFVAGHIGLIAIMTLTSFTFTFVDHRRYLFLPLDLPE